MTQNKFRKFIVLLLLLSFTSITNCFGKFAIVRKVYEFNDSLKAGDGFINKFVKTLVMYAFWIIPVWGISFAVDLIIVNLIEFWTDNNIIGLNEYNEEGIYVKNFENGNESLTLTYSNFGSRMQMDIRSGNQEDSLIVLRKEPGKIYKEVDGSLQEIQMSSVSLGNKTILKMWSDGKLKSSRIIETQNLRDLEKSFL
ncbi:MAG: DUF3332 family protein [Leptospiraceae bacterium]|nr:DUF3332 family protein [Leptospiraceae bacterium]MCP5511735.1 DUF3332 family protein [Leptospiraceae bacterium]